jgi:hypothetical protein
MDDNNYFINNIQKIKIDILNTFIIDHIKLNFIISDYDLNKKKIDMELLEINEKIKNIEIEKKIKEKNNLVSLSTGFSLIIDNPINYTNYSLSKYCKFIELELEKNDCLFIPKGWFHWITTEPKTLSVNYEINQIESKHENTFYNNLKKKIPFTFKRNNINIKYDDIIDKLLKNDFSGCIVSDSYIDHSPIVKPYQYFNKIFDNRKISDILYNKEFINDYMYITHETTSDDIYNKYSIFPNIKNDIINCNNILYTANLWINFDKKIQMGIHYDQKDSILSILDGKKKILLASPNEKSKLYLTCNKMITSRN